MDRSRTARGGDRTLPIELVLEAVAFAAHRGWDVDALLRDAGIPRALLVSGRARITESQGIAMVQRLWTTTDDEAFGMAEHPLPRGSFRLLLYAALGSRNLAEALARATGFVDAIPAVPSLRLTVGTEARVTLGMPAVSDPANRLMAPVALGVLHRTMIWATKRPIDLIRVELPITRPENAEIVSTVFGAPQTYGTDFPALVFKPKVLASPIVRDAAALDEFIRRSPADLMTRPRSHGSGTAERVRALIERSPLNASPSATEIASRLALSEATLRRHLTAEGTSYRQIRDAVLRDAAVASLMVRDDPIATIAAELGFSEASAFTRAFQRWTGSAPSAYRERT
jgi:AraC-like DNA-binding protein